MPTSSPPSDSSKFNRRQLLAGASAGAAALLMDPQGAEAQGQPSGAVIFTHTKVVNPGSVRDNVALAVEGGRIAAIGPTDTVLRAFPGAQQYDGRKKAILPGLINCHAHMTATIARGFNEDFGFPNSAHLSLRPESLLSSEERALMATISALECVKGGTTAVVEYAGGISSYAANLARSGLRCVLMESVSDSETGAGPMSLEALAKSVPPKFLAKKREQGLQRINDLFSAWHGKEQGRISVFPAAALAETSSPELLKAVRGFAEKHDLGYSIHLSQSRPEVAYMKRFHHINPPIFLGRHDFLGPRLFAAHCRYVDAGDIALLGDTRTIISHQAAMAANRGVIPPIPDLRKAGCPIANGTDNNTNDMLEVMRIALVTERIRRDDPNPGLRPQPEDMLRDATIGGAHALRQDDQIGLLEVGRKADLIVLDTQHAHLVPAGRILSAWIHNGQPSDVETVMVDGAFVMRDRKVLTMDEAGLIAEADKVGRRVWARVKAANHVTVPGWPTTSI